MKEIRDVISKLEGLKSNIESIAIESYKKKGELMSELNRKQLSSGVDIFGRKTPTYAPSSQKKGKTGNVKFFDKGFFTEGIDQEFESDGIEFFSKDNKNRFLNPYFHTRSDDFIFTLGLTNESIARLNEEVAEDMIDSIKELLLK